MDTRLRDAERLLRTYRESHCGTDSRCNKCRMTDEYLSSSESEESAVKITEEKEREQMREILFEQAKRHSFAARQAGQDMVTPPSNEGHAAGLAVAAPTVPEEPQALRVWRSDPQTFSRTYQQVLGYIDALRSLLAQREERIKRLEKSIGTVHQALLEVAHAQEVGPEWYTRGESGLKNQVRMWVKKGLAAIDAMTAEAAERGDGKG